MNYCDVEHDGTVTSVLLPPDWTFARIALWDRPSVGDVYTEVRRALKQPVAAPPLREVVQRIVHTAPTVCIIVPDGSRPMHQDEIARAVFDELTDSGVGSEQITIVVALGTHEPMTDEELRELLGSYLVDCVRVQNHDCWSDVELVDLGVTSQGTPIRVNRTVYEADLRIGIGNVKPHFSAGWSGGAKIIDPGVCGAATVGSTHWHSTFYSPRELYARAENPMRHEIETIGREVGLEYVVNAVLNKRDEPAFLAAGDCVLAHRACVRYAEDMYAIDLDQPADVLVVGMGLWASDFWAAVVGYFMGEFLVRPGGDVILFSACPRGIAPAHLEIERYGYPPTEEIRLLVSTGELTNLAAASHMVLVSRLLHERAVDLTVVSAVAEQQTWARLGISAVATAEEAVARVKARQGPSARVRVLSATSVADTLVVPRSLQQGAPGT